MARTWPRLWRDLRSWRVLLVGAGGLLVVLGTLASFRSRSERIPQPNGIDILGAAGSAISGNWPNDGRLPTADPVDLRAFVDRNREALELARSGLDRESLVVFANNEEGLMAQATIHRRLLQVTRLLAADHFAASAEGKIEEAWRSDLDALRVGQAGTQGGMLVHAQLCWSLQGYAIDRIRGLRDRLGSADCRAILASLAEIDRRRVAPAALVGRWERWYAGAFGLPLKITARFNGIEAAERKNQQARAKAAADKIGRSFRFLMVELAIHAYVLDRKALPRSLGDLVPAYLPRIPIDPTTGLPIDYPKTPGGDLAEDLGNVGGSEVEGKAPAPPPAPG